MSTGDMTIRTSGDFQFACNYWETSNAWGHEVRLCKHGVEVGRARVRYYNRTWEAYTFQSAMYSAVENYKQKEIERYLNNYKLTHELKGWNYESHEEWEKPFKRGEKAQALKEFETTETAKDIKALKEYVERGE